ncbi:MAG: SelL-related redox protein [Chitinophagales bacterium]|nr:SelL-related redox protein [Chitinophagales bacterium]
MRLISSRNSQWMKAILFIAGIYSIFWGASVVIAPQFWFNLAGLSTPDYIQLWQLIGVYSIAMGVGYLIAYTNPMRQWPIVLIGLIVKVLTPIGFLFFYLKGQLPWIVFQMNITNDLIWWVPFGLILYNAYLHDYLLDKEIINCTEHNIKDLLSWHHTQHDESILEISQKQPVMLIFLRHFGCTFCRETLHEVGANKEVIESQGVRIVLVHQLPVEEANQYFQKFDLANIDSVSDPELILYKGFHLKRGKITQIFGPKDLITLILKGKFFKWGISSFKDEDPFQMPGVFMVKDGKIVAQFVHSSVSDSIPYQELTKCICSAKTLSEN